MLVVLHQNRMVPDISCHNLMHLKLSGITAAPIVVSFDTRLLVASWSDPVYIVSLTTSATVTGAVGDFQDALIATFGWHLVHTSRLRAKLAFFSTEGQV